ncbi:TraB/GumN family protein [Flavobacterium antarcticum]|uniref:TraB/GumN family protein n=1 Tax=Flavobacterium antarcticum TaxID=271155 RepID=UPI0003B6DC1B|nr:TraB/GumN family protein [Flavobacterium antarcticum]
MKNLFILALSLLSIVAFGQNDNSLLYKISGNGIEKPSYVFGTIHISCNAKLDDEILNALDNTSQMYLELDMDDPEMQTNVMKSMSMKDGVTIKSLVSEEDYYMLDKYLMSKMRVSADLFNTYKPFLVSSMFLTTLLDCSPESFENELVKVSKAQKEPVYGLETVAEQMAIFDKIPYKVQARELINSVKNDFQEDKVELDELLHVYADKNLDEMERLSKKSKSAIMTDYEDLLLKNRNERWIPKIEKISKEKPTFYGVGAAHLIGEFGIINLLRKKGYKVEAIIN